MTDPNFSSPITNPFNLADVGAFAKPTFADIDNDGDLDAFVGSIYSTTSFYRNTGTATVPSFTLEATNPFGLTSVGSFTSPTFADIDNDGDLDAFVGNMSGNTQFFRNTGTATAPSFTFGSNNPFGRTSVGSYASPTFADIDNDGDLDAFVGNRDGNTLFYRNTGTASAPSFPLDATNPFDEPDLFFFDERILIFPTINPFGLTDVGNFAAPTFADIDNDGDLDAFVGNSEGNTLFYRNTGTASAPSFTLDATNNFGLTDVGAFAAPTFADIDNDGDLDAFVGNSDGNTLFFLNTAPTTPVNSPPTATNDSNTTNENTAVAGNVLTNDTDPNAGDTLTVAAVNGSATDVGNQITLASGALLTLNSNGTYNYNPNGKFESLGAGQTGSDSFTYTVSDGKGGTSNATVTVNITGVNDAPTGTPTATLAAGTEDTAYTITAASLLQGFSDVDSGDTLSVSNLTATNGNLVNNNNGTYTFTPNANYNGVVNLSYGVTDGTATLAGQTRSFSVTAVNDAPVAVNDSTTAFQNTAVTIATSTLLANDSDVDSPSSALRITGVSGATNGTVALNTNNTPTNFADDFITFTPNNGFSGNAGFSYTLSDGTLSRTASVQIAVGKNINGTNNNDNLTGTASNDVIKGLNSQDTLSGNGGNDKIDGGNGDDKLYGGDGKDTLIGGTGQDLLWGDAGDDLLFGGQGNDTVTGGSGSDIFALGKSNGMDTITDFSLGQGDKIGLLNGLTFNQLSFSGNQILAGGDVLGVLNGFNTNTLTAANFVSVSEPVI